MVHTGTKSTHKQKMNGGERDMAEKYGKFKAGQRKSLKRKLNQRNRREVRFELKSYIG
jgi:hypothetical protein